MKVLVLGASGATGRLVVAQLIERRIAVRIVLRKIATLASEILDNPLVEVEQGNISEIEDSRMISLLHGCDAVVSCLGHTVTIQGMFGKPRGLVFDTIRKIHRAVGGKSGARVKLILMSTTGYANTLTGEKSSAAERLVFSILKLILPPHRDNVQAAKYLRDEIGKENEKIEWIAVRPDTLVNADTPNAYEVHASPVRSPLFNAGTTSRINVGHFMADLLTNEGLWQAWRFKMPVIYNK